MVCGWKRFVAVFLLNISHLLYAHEEYKRFEKIFDNGLNTYIIGDWSPIAYGHHLATNDNSFIYLNCSYGVMYHHFPDEVNYTTILNTPHQPWDTENISRKICRSSIRSPMKNPVINEKKVEINFSNIRLSATERLSRDKIINIWHEERLYIKLLKENTVSNVNVTVSIFDVEKCKETNVKFQADNEFKSNDVKVVIYNDGFDIFTCGDKLCKTPTCKKSYDLNGHQIGGTICSKSYLKDYQLKFNNPIVKSSLKDGFKTLLFEHDTKKSKMIVHLGRNGSETLIARTDKFNSDSTFADSDSNGKYTVCQIQQDIIYCIRTNETNDSVDYGFSLSENFTNVLVYNSIDKGLYIALSKCLDHKCGELKIMKVDEDDQFAMQGTIPKSDKGFKVPRVLKIDISENGSDFCVYTASDDYKSNASFDVFCTPKRNFDSVLH